MERVLLYFNPRSLVSRHIFFQIFPTPFPMIKTVFSNMWEIGPTGSTSLTWFNQPKTDDRTRWFFQGKPCSLVAMAVAEQKVVALRVRVDDGDHTVAADQAGVFPGLGYEVPGDA